MSMNTSAWAWLIKKEDMTQSRWNKNTSCSNHVFFLPWRDKLAKSTGTSVYFIVSFFVEHYVINLIRYHSSTQHGLGACKTLRKVKERIRSAILKHVWRTSSGYTIALDESTNITDVAYLANTCQLSCRQFWSERGVCLQWARVRVGLRVRVNPNLTPHQLCDAVVDAVLTW